MKRDAGEEPGARSELLADHVGDSIMVKVASTENSRMMILTPENAGAPKVAAMPPAASQATRIFSQLSGGRIRCLRLEASGTTGGPDDG